MICVVILGPIRIKEEMSLNWVNQPETYGQCLPNSYSVPLKIDQEHFTNLKKSESITYCRCIHTSYCSSQHGQEMKWTLMGKIIKTYYKCSFYSSV